MYAAALSTRAGTILAVGVIALSAAPAQAQRVMSTVSSWNFTAPLLNPNNVTGDIAGVEPFFTNNSGLAMVRGRLRLRQNGDMTADRAEIGVGPLRYTFTLNQQADVFVPMLIDPTVIMTGANNAGVVSFTVNAELFQDDGTGNFVSTGMGAGQGYVFNGGTPGTSNLNDTRYASFQNIAASTRAYQVRFTVSMDVNAYGGGANPVNNGAVGTTTEMRFNNANEVIAASVAAVPSAYRNSNSRAAVGAGAARSAFAVNGSGGPFLQRANVGVLEPGVSYNNHTSLAGRLTILSNGAAANQMNEHTLAVTGIIASNGPNESSSGVAPGARVASASITDYPGTIAGAQAIVNHYGAGSRVVINYSASDGNCTVQALDSFLTANPNVTWVSAGGNEQLSGPWPSFPAGGRPPSLGNVETPEYAYNSIAVGAMEGNFAVPTDFSSTSLGNQPQTPHIMAPGEYVLSPLSRNTNDDNQVNDYGRTFLGDDYRIGSPTVGRIAGTSFAAPHVTGAIALMHDYAQQNPTRFDATSCDQRVMKAVLLAGATTTGIWDRAGNAWHQDTTGGGYDGDPLLVHRSLDQNLGSGMLAIPSALRIMSGGEARVAEYTPANAPRNAQITPNWFSANGAIWDYETVGARAGGINGTVDYFLPTTLLAGTFLNPSNEEVTGVRLTPDFSFLRSCLTWDRTVTGATYDPLANLQLRLYADRPDNINNLPGFDANNPGADILIAMTDGAGENVRLLDMDTIHSFYEIHSPDQVLAGWSFYLQVTNLSDTATTYGIAVSLIPTPSGAVLLAALGVFASRRRRA